MADNRCFKILLVDEHQPSLAVLSHALTSHGHVCESVRTAAEALERARSWQPDVFVYEWNLRHGDGLGLAKRIRAASASVTMVIAVSAQTEPDDFREVEEVDEYIVKPFDGRDLHRVLTRS